MYQQCVFGKTTVNDPRLNTTIENEELEREMFEKRVLADESIKDNRLGYNDSKSFEIHKT